MRKGAESFNNLSVRSDQREDAESYSNGLNAKSAPKIHGRHEVLFVTRDPNQSGFLEHTVVWRHIDNRSVFVTKVDRDGRAFKDGRVIDPIYLQDIDE